jgi:XTP/dITP diphosphohydrolase
VDPTQPTHRTNKVRSQTIIVSIPTLYIATSNPGKVRDFSAAADHFGFSIAPLPGLERISPPPENEATFEGNAREKALYYSRLAPGYAVLADDSGLEVDALHGDPGVRSARYASDAGFTPIGNGDEDNNLLLLKNLFGIEDRAARYRCVLALARDGKVLLTAVGAVEGRIAEKPQGIGGFGYDPIFYLPELNQTMAEIDLATKSALSHRGRALQSLFANLQAAGDLRGLASGG